ncbi:MAG TPA: HypC/HybG/HupF family hydrogenase formation chaperone [Polyangiaceae bacterium]|nr:HypC/HybG/HupF family hydrogenase formation chaperone [Polyangiaceae bacterium]
MCLAVPGRLVEVSMDGDVRMGKVSFGGVSRGVCLECVPAAVPGDYVLVHVGFALSVIDEAEANRVFAMLAELDPGALEEATS